MGKLVVVFIVALLAIAPMSPEHANAAEKSNGATLKNIVKRPGQGATTVLGDAPVALTSKECTDLGGTVNAYEGACKTGQACHRTGEDGKFYSVCISSLK